MGDICSTSIADTSLRFKIQYIGTLTPYLIHKYTKRLTPLPPTPYRIAYWEGLISFIGFLGSYDFRLIDLDLSGTLRARCVLKARGDGRVGAGGDVFLGLMGIFLHAALGRVPSAVELLGQTSGSEGSSEGVLLGDLLGALFGDLLLPRAVFELPLPGSSSICLDLLRATFWASALDALGTTAAWYSFRYAFIPRAP